MAYVKITDDCTREDIEQAIGHLRAKRNSTDLDTIRAAIDVDIDELLEQWARASA